MAEPLLSVRNLTVEFTIRGGVVPVIDDLSFDLDSGGTLSLVGESGCGKSMTALAIMGLIPSPRGVGSNLTHPWEGIHSSTQACALRSRTTTRPSSRRVPGVNPSTTREGIPSMRAITAIDVENCSQ